jgi:phosphatidylinositol kinase/protein kinase (PI-3  family)
MQCILANSHSCFSRRMPDPATWLQARTTFTRTTAAWSIAGHIVGLGDRHCDNLLIDVQTGANVQIDFGHLFDSARDLPVPEIVPFRLTQNMIDSFGVCGVEGGFRINCGAGMSITAASAPVLVLY